MSKRFFALLLSLALVLMPMSANAAGASNVYLNASNKYTWTTSNPGTYEWTVPYTGWYDISVNGAQGSAWGAGGGQAGYSTNISRIHLNVNQVVRVQLGASPSYTLSGGNLTLNGGQASKLWIDNELYVVSGGGSGQINDQILPDGATQATIVTGEGTSASVASGVLGVHWHSGNGKSGATHATEPWDATVYSTATPTGCYVWAGHTHGYGGCEEHQVIKETYGAGTTGHHCPICGRSMTGHYGAHGDGDDIISEDRGHDMTFSCSGGPCNDVLNTWKLNCGYQNGQVLGLQTSMYRAGDCYVNGKISSLTSQSLTATGNGSARIALCEQSNLFYQNITANYPFYKNGRVDLVLRDLIVIYYKRY